MMVLIYRIAPMGSSVERHDLRKKSYLCQIPDIRKPVRGFTDIRRPAVDRTVGSGYFVHGPFSWGVV